MPKINPPLTDTAIRALKPKDKIYKNQMTKYNNTKSTYNKMRCITLSKSYTKAVESIKLLVDKLDIK